MLLSKRYIGLFGALSLLFFVMSRASAQENTMTSMTRTEHDSYSVALPDRQQKALFALKTNVLFDAALCLNAEIEVPIDRNNRWSIMAEFWKPWFVWKNNSRAYQIQVIGGEVRYWLGKDRSQRKQLTGWFGGIYYANGKYDFEWNSKGDQGEFNSVGATIGYSWSIHRRWNLELSGSIGHLWGPRRHYATRPPATARTLYGNIRPIRNTLVRQNSRCRSYGFWASADKTKAGRRASTDE